MSQVEPQRCVRHPDRTTYLACTRCSRPSCPECLTPAPVGFHCVDCLAAQPTPQGHTRLGYTGTDGNPRITKLIIAAAIVVYVAEAVLGNVVQQRFGLIGYYVAGGEWWRLFSVGFLHAGIFHIAFNMYALWLLGPNLERVLGHDRFAFLYGAALLGGSTASYVFNDPRVLAVGASGAIYGLFGAMVVISRRLGIDSSGIYGILAINLAISFIFPNIDWHAHLGGLATGALTAWLLAGRAPKALRISGGIAALVTLFVALALRTAALT